jgi:hypothetical protein
MTANRALDEEAGIIRQLQGSAADKERRAKILGELLAAQAEGPEAVTEVLTARFDVLREDFLAQLGHLQEQL